VDPNYDISYVNGTLSVVAAGSLQITTTSLPPAALETKYGFTLQATGGVAPYKWKVASGRLPKGLKLTSAGGLGGFPSKKATPGTFNITVQVQDHTSKKQGGKQTATQSLTLTLTSASTGTTKASPKSVASTKASPTSVASAKSPPKSVASAKSAPKSVASTKSPPKSVRP